MNGLQCNGRGNCQVTYTSDAPEFQCACESGWNGTKCDNVVDGMNQLGMCVCVDLCASVADFLFLLAPTC